MGCCLSKTETVLHPQLSSVEPEPKLPPKLENVTNISAVAEPEIKEEEEILEKEVLVMNQARKSHEKRSDSSEPESTNNPQAVATKIMEMAAVRTSSCTKEEVDAILIQCGRLSRSSSGKCGSSGSNRKYSGSKRSHDFDKESVPIEMNNCDENEDDERQRRRQSRGSHRRNTPSRSRERDPQGQKSGGGGGRRLSQSPRKRSEATNNNSTTTSSNGGNRPGKLVSVPATVTSMSMEKSSNGEGGNTGNVKRVLVRRNVTPPRSRSPARSGAVKNSNQNQPSPNRNAARKTEHSPYRRTPLTDLDMNSLPFQPLANKSTSIKTQQTQSKVVGGAVQGSHRRAKSRGGEGSEQSTENLNLGPAVLTRTRSQRRSRDLDVESPSNPNPATNYTSLLLQDIQNFHQKGSTSTSTNAAPFKLPDCVSKACSIVEAVADMNLNSSSTTRTVGGRVKDEDLMEPSLQKFVTVEKGKEFDEREESSGSNNVAVVSGQNQRVSSSASSWEMSSEGVSPASFQRVAASSCSRTGVARTRAVVGGR